MKAAKRWLVRAVLVLLVFAGLTLGGAQAANATEAPVESAEPVATALAFVTVAWEMPEFLGDKTPSWPQAYALSVETEAPDITAVDSALKCGTAYQVDVYNNSAGTKELIAGGVLNGPHDPFEDLVRGGWGVAYKLVLTPDCPVVEPTPEPTPTEPPVETPPAVTPPGASPPMLAETGEDKNVSFLWWVAGCLFGVGITMVVFSAQRPRN